VKNGKTRFHSDELLKSPAYDGHIRPKAMYVSE